MSNAKKSYDQINIFEIISTFEVDIYVRHLYNFAVKEHQSNNAGTITDAYRSVASTYRMQLNDSKSFNATLSKMYDYASRNISVPTYKTWIHAVLKEFIPRDFLENMTDQIKFNVFMNIMREFMDQFYSLMISGANIKKVIDERNNEANIRLFQDNGCVLLSDAKEMMFKRFVDPKHTSSDQFYRNKITDLKNNEQKLLEQLTIYKKKYNLLIEGYKKLKIAFDENTKKLARKTAQQKSPSQFASAATQPTVATLQPMVATSQFTSSATQPMITASQFTSAAPQSMVATSQFTSAATQPMVAASQPMVATSQPMVATPQSLITTSPLMVATSQPMVARQTSENEIIPPPPADLSDLLGPPSNDENENQTSTATAPEASDDNNNDFDDMTDKTSLMQQIIDKAQ